jgi:nucleotide-binding universal stress UspA family protein
MNLMLQKILIAIGDSPESEKVLEAGLMLAEKFGAKVSVLHVLNLFRSGFEPAGNSLMGGNYPMMNDLAIEQYQRELQESEKLGRERLQLCAKQANDRHITAEIFQTTGDPGRTICDLAKKSAADVIVIGRHQQSVLSEIFLGSTSNYVLHHAPCSVMVIQQG